MASACALSSRKDVIVLDDILSGLGATTEEHVVQRCFGPDGLLPQGWTTTVILANHSCRVLHLDD